MRTPGCGDGATCTTAATAWVDSNSNSQPTASASAVIRRGASQVGLPPMLRAGPHALRRPQVAGPQATRVDDELLHHDGRVDHPHLQGMYPGPRHDVRRHRAVDVVGRVAL